MFSFSILYFCILLVEVLTEPLLVHLKLNLNKTIHFKSNFTIKLSKKTLLIKDFFKTLFYFYLYLDGLRGKGLPFAPGDGRLHPNPDLPHTLEHVSSQMYLFSKRFPLPPQPLYCNFSHNPLLGLK